MVVVFWNIIFTELTTQNTLENISLVLYTIAKYNIYET
jgi:hypothetical protein